MGIKPFRKSVILKNLRAKYLKGGVSEKMDLAKEAGNRGFSNLQMEKKLKEMGYDPKRRKEVMGYIVGNREIERSDLLKLNIKDLISKYGLSGAEIKDIKKKRLVQKRMNITLGRQSSGDVSGYISDKGGKKRIKQKSKDKESSEDLGVGGISKLVGQYALGKVDNKNYKPDNVTPLTGKQSGPVVNQLSSPGKASGGPKIPLSKAV